MLEGAATAHQPASADCPCIKLTHVLLTQCAGLIDPEGFDDFRVVLGEGSLGGGGERR